MKRLYPVLSLLFIGIVSPALGQQLPVNPLGEGPTLRKQPTKFPWIGVSISIPLRKLFRRKSEVRKFSTVGNNKSAPIAPSAIINDIEYIYDPDCACFVIRGGEVKAPRNEEGFGDPGDTGGGTYPTDPNAPPRPTSPGDAGGGETQPDPYTGLNPCETVYARNHLGIISPLSNNKDLVERWLHAHQWDDGNTNGDSPHNAMKHALFQALNTCSIGIADTRAMANFHEDCNGVRPSGDASFVMDTLNNQIGMNLSQSVGCNFDDLANAVIIAFVTGQLHKIDGQPTP